MHVIINLFKNIEVPKRFLNFPIPYKFITVVQEINAILGQSQIETISYTLNLINSKNIERLETIKKNNISKSINWCHKYKLPYNRINNCNNLSLSRCMLTRLPRPLGQGYMLVECISVTRVRPRTSKGITDLLLPLSSWILIIHVPLRSCNQCQNTHPTI